MADARFAIYFTPRPGSALAQFGAAVLGYDCDAGAEVAQPALPGISPAAMASATSEPRRYGFHATLAAPFRLAPDRTEAGLLTVLESFAATRAPVSLGPLVIGLIGGFIVLKPTTTDAVAFAADCVTTFSPFRAALSAGDRERRIAAGLTDKQIAHLDRWGYPYVLDEFRFHMTLAGPLPEARREAWRAALARLFAGQADEPALIDAVSVVRQDGRGARFHVVRREPLRG